MERLSIDEVIAHCNRHTERMESHSGRRQLEETPIGNSNIMRQYWEHRQVAEWLKQLKAYEDAKEQGLLFRLPCKVGDIAYYVHREYLTNADKWINTIDEVEVDSFILNINLFVNVSLHIGGDVFRKTLTPYKTLFFTSEEAEAAVERMKGEVNEYAKQYKDTLLRIIEEQPTIEVVPVTGINSVIDEFAKKATECIEEMNCEAWKRDIMVIAERMKGGTE